MYEFCSYSQNLNYLNLSNNSSPFIALVRESVYGLVPPVLNAARVTSHRFTERDGFFVPYESGSEIIITTRMLNRLGSDRPIRCSPVG